MKLQWKNLTYIQVEALRECFDFIANGYVDEKSYFDNRKWTIWLRHAYNRNKIKMIVTDSYYTIEKNIVAVKHIEGCPDNRRYNAQLNSQGEIEVVRSGEGVNSMLVSGSVLHKLYEK